MKPLVAWDDPILYKPTLPVTFGDDNQELIEDLFSELSSAVKHYGGYGLTANQIGIPYSAFVLNIGPDVMLFLNPKITFRSTEENLLDEGCLSFPGLVAKIPRSTTIRLRYQNFKGETSANQFTGLTARVIQHEMCHIEGRPFFAGFSKFKIERMVKKASNKVGVKYNTLELSKL